jgi:hypothetical protein
MKKKIIRGLVVLLSIIAYYFILIPAFAPPLNDYFIKEADFKLVLIENNEKTVEVNIKKFLVSDSLINEFIYNFYNEFKLGGRYGISFQRNFYKNLSDNFIENGGYEKNEIIKFHNNYVNIIKSKLKNNGDNFDNYSSCLLLYEMYNLQNIIWVSLLSIPIVIILLILLIRLIRNRRQN